MPANVRETLIAFSKGKQVDVATINSTLLRLNKVNAQFASMRLNSETDAADIGKGHEWATRVYNTSWDATGRIEKYLSSVWAAYAFGFVLGSVAEAAPNYTITPLDPVVDDINIPAFTFCEQIRPGGSSIIDRAAVGCVGTRLQLNFRSGPGRASSTLAMDFAGSGKIVKPSGLTIPAATDEFLLPSASVTMTALGTDYVTLQRILDAEFIFDNAFRDPMGFFPGSGFQTPGDGDSGAISGRMWFGDRTASLVFNALLASTSDEEAKQLAGTTGTVVITFANGANHTLSITLHDVRFTLVEAGDVDGLVKVQVTCEPLYDSSNGLITVAVKTNVTGIAA